MTNKEMRELDIWLAEHIFGRRIYRKGDKVPLPTDSDLSLSVEWEEGADEGIVIRSSTIPSVLRYSADPLAFVPIKREIERRGWSWGTRHLPFAAIEERYTFTVHTGYESTSRTAYAKTEELAGCMALKAAVEATEIKMTALGDMHVTTVELNKEGDYVVGSIVRGLGDAEDTD